MAEPGILVANTNALLYWGERRISIRKDVTTVREGHPILAGREHLFRPWSIALDYDPATAKPAAEPAPQVDAKAVRAWADKEGLDVPARGKLPADVVAQYQAAQGA